MSAVKLNVVLQRLSRWAAEAACLLLLGSATQAAPFTSLVTFGDDLSDTGNVFLASGGTTPAVPYFNGRFSDGPVWIDHLAAGLGLPTGAVPALAGGNNYAFGGARTGTGPSPVPGLLAQIGGLWGPAHPIADPNALYVVVGGMNDMRDARSAFTTNAAGDQAGRQAAAATAANNILTSIALLASRGARHVLISTLPDLGATPEAASLGLVGASSDATARYNSLVLGIEGAAEALFAGLDVVTFDMAGVAAAIRDDALNNGGGVYGITNVFTPCGVFPGSIGISCSVSMHSDALHPSARFHNLIGVAAIDVSMPTQVPEPGTLALLGLGLAGLAATRRRKQ